MTEEKRDELRRLLNDGEYDDRLIEQWMRDLLDECDALTKERDALTKERDALTKERDGRVRAFETLRKMLDDQGVV